MSVPNYPVPRNLDGVYVRVERYGKSVNRCFSDLTTEEQERFMSKFDTEGLKRLCLLMTERLRDIGDQLDLYVKDEE